MPLRRSFHYLPPKESSSAAFKAGQRIWVPFGRQKLVGIVLGTVTETDIAVDKIKHAIELIDSSPIFSATLFKICRWAANYYQHPIGEVLHTALPVLLRRGEPATATTRRLFPEWDADQLTSLNRAPRQKALLNLLLEHKDGLSRAELQRLDISSQTIKAMLDRQAVYWKNVISSPIAELPTHPVADALSLNSEQSAALSKLSEARTHLLFGITGSGKTEVYLQAISSVLAAGKQALVLVPEIGLTPQTIKRFRDRFQQSVVALHSGLTDRERLTAWQDARSGEAAVVIGTRSAIFTQLKNIGLIVVDEEHDGSFKQQDGFRYSARDLAVMRGQTEKIPVILGSATPSFESLLNAINGKYLVHKLEQRPTGARQTAFKVIPTKHATMQEGFSTSLIEQMQQHLEAGNQVLVFLNRRGFAPVLHCRQCSWISTCHRCDARMTYHLTTRSLNCHHCGHQSKAPRTCPACQSDQIVPLGLGTQRLEQGLQRLFPEEKIIRIDRDSTRKKGAMEAIVAEANEGKRSILLGTQLLAKGHHFPDVTLVAIIDLDGGFYSADYRAIERMGQLLLQVSGRAGREQKPGTVAIQTAFPEEPILQCLITEGYEAFALKLLKERKQYDLPPYHHQAVIRAESTGRNTAIEYLQKLAESYQTGPTHTPSVQVLGPFPSSMERLAGKYRAQLLFSSGERPALQKVLRQCVQLAETDTSSRNVRWSVDVDPYDLF